MAATGMMHTVCKWLLPVLLILGGCAHKPPAPAVPGYTQDTWQHLPDWQDADMRLSLAAMLQSCKALQKRQDWQEICTRASALDANDNALIHHFFEEHFTPWQLHNADGSHEGLITGYYEPLLHGSRTPNDHFRYAIYGVPDDLLVIDLADMYPQLKGLRLRGRLDGQRVVPYYDRWQIENGHAPRGKELFWVDDPVDLFFLHVQGSGRIQLEDGSIIKIGYANQNGHPYRSIGKQLIDMGELTADNVSLQSIREWAREHPDRLPELLASNPSYVFFRVLPDALPAPLGALGVPLTGEYSLAVDRNTIPLGLPVYLATTWPASDKPLERLMMAQDTGGAIKGTIRADFFWGFGDEAGARAGRMKQQGRLWVLFPRDMTPPAPHADR